MPPTMLKGKKILLGVCGSIAAYKAAFLVRLLVKKGATVKVIMTSYATEFITPLTLATLSGNKVLTHFTALDQQTWNSHVDLGNWADLFIIAPATANTMANMNTGLCDNLLLAAYLSARCPVWIAPAMDLDMWHHPATKQNTAGLKQKGNRIIPVETGELASGLEGEGRMSEPESILKLVEEHFGTAKKKLLNKTVLITAGPTIEAIDPVRYISNHSSGKMGFALAEAFHKAGADVILIKGPTAEQVPENVCRVIDVQTADEMFDAVQKHFTDCNILIAAAAVADYTPKETAASKIKKTSGEMIIRLEKTKDILKEMASQKKPGQLVVGFALETDNEIENAKAKLKQKNLDLIILNSLREKGAGFKHDTNKVTMIDRSNKITNFELKPKHLVAEDILEKIIALSDE